MRRKHAARLQSHGRVNGISFLVVILGGVDVQRNIFLNSFFKLQKIYTRPSTNPNSTVHPNQIRRSFLCSKSRKEVESPKAFDLGSNEDR